MIIIEHRINTIDQLRRVPPERGIEVDIRDYDGELRLAHDPFQSGERLADLLAEYRHAFIIFNTKSDGLVEPVQALAHRYGIGAYFFLDLASPTLINLARRGERRIAVRYSEFEPLEAALALAGLVEWVWVDCFTHLPLTADSHRRLAEHFKICLVSPEMQSHPRGAIQDFRRQLAGLPLAAVCTDLPEEWR